MLPLICLGLLKLVVGKVRLPAIRSHKYCEGAEPGRRLDTADTGRGHYLGLYIQWHLKLPLGLSVT